MSRMNGWIRPKRHSNENLIPLKCDHIHLDKNYTKHSYSETTQNQATVFDVITCH